MGERLPNNFVRQRQILTTIKTLLLYSGIKPSSVMVTSNHPQLGGGVICSLGDPSDHKTSFLVNSEGKFRLWNEFSRAGWMKTKKKEIIKWLKNNKNLTKSHLDIPSDSEIREMIAETMG